MPVNVQKSYSSGIRSDKMTHNFCDMRTWYQQSTQVLDEELNTSDNIVFTLTEPSVIIDPNHGRITGERSLRAKYSPVVKVNGIQVYEDTAEGVVYDFTLDYKTGTVTFHTALEATDVVIMTYWYPKSSLFTIKPSINEILEIRYIEVQLSLDLCLNDTLVFQLWGDLGLIYPDSYPEGTMYPLVGAEYYQTLDDYIADSEKSYPIIPVFNQPGNWRHYTSARMLFRFDYTERFPTRLISSYAYEIRCWLENHIELGGEYAVGTFYGTKEEEE